MKKLLIAILLLSGMQRQVWAQTEWSLNSEKDGVKVYTKVEPGSKIKAIRVEGIFNAMPTQLVALLMDVNNGAKWMYHTKSSMLVKQVSESELYYYSEVSMPWPVANRDFVAHLMVSQDPQTKVVTIEGPAEPDLVPQKPGIVRIKVAYGKWIITPLQGEQIKVEYTLHVDPAGSLPAWVVNMFAAEGPAKIFKEIKVQLQKRTYKDNVFVFLTDK